MIPRTDVVVELVGSDGNAFALIGKVASALRQAGESSEAERFLGATSDCRSYEDLLVLIMRTVQVA